MYAGSSMTAVSVRMSPCLVMYSICVAWSLIGLRKGSEYQQDVEKINPLHIIAVGLAAVFLLVVGLIGLVNWIV